MTKIMFHTCAHEYQDEVYGQGMRVCNKTKQNSSDTSSWRCSVCGKDVSSGVVDKKKAK